MEALDVAVCVAGIVCVLVVTARKPKQSQKERALENANRSRM